MTSDKLREILRTQPSQPFVLHLADGRAIEVAHPELMAISPSGRIAYVFVPGDRRDSGHRVDLLMIMDVEVRVGRVPERGGRRRKAG